MDHITNVKDDAHLIDTVERLKAQGRFDPVKPRSKHYKRTYLRGLKADYKGRLKPDPNYRPQAPEPQAEGKDVARLWMARLKSGNPTLTYRDLHAGDRKRAYEAERARDPKLQDANGKLVKGPELVALWKARIETKNPHLAYRDMVAMRAQHALERARAYPSPSPSQALEKDRRPTPAIDPRRREETPARDAEHARAEQDRRRRDDERRKLAKTPEKKAQEKDRKDGPVKIRGRKRPDQGRER